MACFCPVVESWRSRTMAFGIVLWVLLVVIETDRNEKNSENKIAHVHSPSVLVSGFGFSVYHDVCHSLRFDFRSNESTRSHCLSHIMPIKKPLESRTCTMYEDVMSDVQQYDFSRKTDVFNKKYF